MNHLENLKQGDSVYISERAFTFMWFYNGGIDLKVKDSIQIIHIPCKWFYKIKFKPEVLNDKT